MITVKVMIKIQKRTINSSKNHTPLHPSVSLDGDVDGVDRKTSLAQEEARSVS